MIGALVYLVISLAVLGLICWFLLYAIQSIPMAQPFSQIIRVVIIVGGCLIAVLLLLNFLGVMPGGLFDARLPAP